MRSRKRGLSFPAQRHVSREPNMEPERIRPTIEATVSDWLRDYDIQPGKEHRQLVNRIVAAVLAMQQAEKEPPPQSLACGD